MTCVVSLARPSIATASPNRHDGVRAWLPFCLFCVLCVHVPPRGLRLRWLLLIDSLFGICSPASSATLRRSFVFAPPDAA